jgi:hypothetical protein
MHNRKSKPPKASGTSTKGSSPNSETNGDNNSDPFFPVLVLTIPKPEVLALYIEENCELARQENERVKKEQDKELAEQQKAAEDLHWQAQQQRLQIQQQQRIRSPKKLEWKLPASLPPTVAKPLKRQLAQGQNIPALEKQKLEWKLPAVMPPEDESLKEQLGQNNALPEKLEWKLPATPPPLEPEIEDIEPDLDEGMQPRMLP